MSSLALYRQLIPAHAGVSPETVAAHLTLAAGALTASAWGARYAEAVVYLAAHRVERTPRSGANSSTAEEAGAVTAQSDAQSEGGGNGSSTLSRSYAAPTGGTAEEQELQTTRYGQAYLSIRASRAATAPTVIPSASLTRCGLRRCL